MEEQSWRPDASAKHANIIRRLGCLESYQVALQNLDQMRGIILAYQYKLPAWLATRQSQHELISTFERAVSRVVLKHPHLHVGLVGEDTDKPCWVSLDSINLQNHIEWRIVRGGAASDLQKVFLEISNQQLDTKFIDYRAIPGWKIKVLRQEGADFIEVLLVLNHTNMDGSSARTFHRDLLQNLHDNSQASEDDLLRNHVLTLPEDSTAKLSPPAEKLVNFPVDESAMIHYLQQEVQTPAARYPKSPTQAHWAPIAAAPFKTQFRTITIPNDVLSKLVQACRYRRTTLTGLLHALVLVSLAPLLEPSKALAFESLTAMDLRPFLPSDHPLYPWLEPERAISNYVTIVNHILDEDIVARLRSQTLPCASDSSQSEVLMDLMWTAARKVRREVEAKVAQGLQNDMNGFAQAVDDWRAQLSEEARRPRRTSWVITNLGLIDGRPAISPSAADVSPTCEPESTWSVTRTQLIMCANVVASAIGVSTATVKGGDLIVTCAWQDCVIDINLGDAFVTSLEKWLNFTSRYQDGWPASPGHGSSIVPP